MKKQHIPFTEYFLHYVWRTKQIQVQNLTTTDGKKIEILHFGQYNENAGPDFLQATVRIEDTIWVGHIEMHVLSSDWEKHRHQCDKAYQNVILHVVYFQDKAVNEIPCFSLYNKIPKVLIQRYHELLRSKTWIPCAKVIHGVPDNIFNLWKDGLLIEKLRIKESHILALLHRYTNDWETCFYILLARYFGGKINDHAFESLAERIPLDLVRKNSHDKMSVQALFFGQAGLLDTTCQDAYVLELKDQYRFLQHKYQLKPLDPVVWKLSKLRPPNFPTIRLAEFSTLQHLGKPMFYKLMEARNLKEMYRLLESDVDTYWHDHYLFGQASPAVIKKTSENFKDVLLINAFLPLALVYAKMYGDDDIKSKIIQTYDELKHENNKIIREWKNLGMKPKTAMDSQALLQLYQAYCQHKNCLSCKIGHQLLVRKQS